MSGTRSGHRLEDEKFLRGRGRFVGDIAEPDFTHCMFLRSPHASARIVSIKVDDALASPGVLGIFIGDDIYEAGLGGIPWEVRPPGPLFADVPLGDPSAAAAQPLIARGETRYMGEILAMVVAETLLQAADGLERIRIRFGESLAYVDPTLPVRAGEEIWPRFASNVCFEFEMGDSERVAQAFARADVVVSYEADNQRISAAPVEPRAYIGRWNASEHSYVLQASAGKPHFARNTMATHVFRIPAERIAVEVPDVGGGFGAKNILYPEECLVLWAARKVGRAVKWVSTRGESLACDLAGRDQRTRAEMAFDSDGKILAYRADALSDLGAYLAPRGVVPIRHSANALSSVYAIEALHIRARGIFTNTTPTCSLRGTGAPEMAYVTERLLDRAARRLNLSPMELRERNLLSAADMPYTTPHGIRYDSGDPRAAADAAIALADVRGFASRRAESESRGMLRGIGIANGIEILNVFYDETAWLELRADGSLLCRMGTQSSGQGHATVYAQLVSEQIGIEIESVTVAQGDTRDIAFGNGTGASRSLSAGGSAAVIAARVFVEAASAFVAEMEGCPMGDVSASNGLWQVAGTNRSYGLGDLARLAGEKQALERLAVEGVFKPTDGTYPYGCDICEAEVDPETGEVVIMSFACVHDVGRAINHAIIDGQVHGSTVQGLGQALLEHLAYDPQGQLLTGSFMDYAMPIAGTAPRIFKTGHLEIASPANPLGAKGVGESGTTGAPPALINAIIDALSPLGVEDISMPATPFRIWKAIRRVGERPT